MDVYSLDYENSAEIDIDVGSYRYANHPGTDILMFAICKNDGEVLVWDSLDPDSLESHDARFLLEEAIRTKSIIRAFNAQHEVAVSRYILTRQLGIPEPDLSQWRCTQAMCNRAAIRAKLKNALKDLGLPEDKDAAGDDLITIFSKGEKAITMFPPPGAKDPETIKPLKNGKFTAGRKPKNHKTFLPLRDEVVRWDWLVKVQGELITLRDAWRMFLEYCRKDVIAERALAAKLHKFELTGEELAAYQFDLRMNYKGVPVNREALRHADKLANQYSERLGNRFINLTGFKHSQTKVLLPWLQERGYQGDNLQADTIEKALEDTSGMTPEGAEALKMRSLLSFAALKKIPAMLACACDDGYVRGSTLYHGARTGRATGRLIQPQNMKKATISDSKLAYEMICDGCSLEIICILWESPLEVIASCARHFIQPHEGLMLDADYTGVEARIAPWIAGETEKLQSILDGKCQYKVMASEIVFHIPYEEVTKEQRTIGKPIELSCIAEDQLVLTPRGEIPIQNVTLDDLVWDGIEWVQHEGLIYQGEREVIEYEGLCATADHQVYCPLLEGTIPFGEAKLASLRLQDGGTPGAQVRGLHTGNPGASTGRRVSVGPRAVCLQGESVAELRQPESREDLAMSTMPGRCTEGPLPEMVSEPVSGGPDSMFESGTPAISRLRGKGDRVPVSLCGSSGPMDDGQLRASEGKGIGPHTERRALRTWESEVVFQDRTNAQQPEDPIAQGFPLPGGRVAVFQGHHGEVFESRDVPPKNNSEGPTSGDRKAEELDRNPKTVRVYDLLNAGPRHRFTVSGKLVSNCVFGTGGEGLLTSLRETHKVQRFIDLDDKVALHECNAIVRAYRQKFPGYKKTWDDMEAAAKLAITDGKATVVADGKIAFGRARFAGIVYLVMRLPSGRRLYYPHPQVKRVFRKYTEEEMAMSEWKREKGGYFADSISFYGKVPNSGHWARIHTWGSRLFENAVQATGADLLNYGCLQAAVEGYDIRMIIHDQILGMDNGLSLEGFIEAFCRKQPWAADFPLAASGAVVPFYLKDD